MFGANEKVGRNYFKNQKPEHLTITSRFFTLQGEGPYSGLPATFIRLTKCNLSCSFCDTFFDKGEEYTFQQIFDQCKEEERAFFDRYETVPDWARYRVEPNITLSMERFSVYKKQIVLVITGGEPSLQTNLVPFLEQANKVYYKSQIESNGILYLDVPAETTYVVSPKCAENAEGQPIRYLSPNQQVLERADCLKFVMSAPDEKYMTYSQIPDWALAWKRKTGKPIYVSPMNIYNDLPQKAKEMRTSNEEQTIEKRSTTDEVISFWEPGLLDLEKNQKNHQYAAKYCMEHGLRMQLQVHLYAGLA